MKIGVFYLLTCIRCGETQIKYHSDLILTLICMYFAVRFIPKYYAMNMQNSNQTTLSKTAVINTSAWTPLSEPLFRWLWIATVVSNIGTWMENIGEGWLMTTLSPSPLLVALVQVATTLPMFILALPSGSLADIFDRRKILLVSQIWMMIAVTFLAVFTSLDIMTPWLLLILTFILGLGAAINAPAWRSITPDIVSKDNLSKAIVLNGLGVNGSRIIGPALGGFIIAVLGTNWVFILNAVSFIGVIFVLYSWDNKTEHSELPAEHFLQSILNGIKYVRHSKIMDITLTHAVAFFPFSSAMFALLPLVARKELGLDSGGYGVMLGFLGMGAVTGAILLPRVQQRFTLHQTVMYGQVFMAVLILLLGLSQNWFVAFLAMFIGGLGWIAVLSNLQTVVLNYVPGWVRSRVMSVYLLTFFAAQSVGSFMWGLVADHTSISLALLIAAAGLILTALLTWKKELPSGKPIDFSPTIFAPVQTFVEQLNYEDGPVIISTEYIIDPQRLKEFTEHMKRVRRARLRAGAYSWYLAKDLNRPERQLEVFMVNSWLEFLRQRERSTIFDKKLQQETDAFQVGDQPPNTGYYLSELG